MLLHIRPRLFSPFRNVALIDLEFPELGINLAGGADLATRRPYRNKGYAVGCRKRGQKPIDGILIETKGWLDAFHCRARWAIEAEQVIVHEVHYRLLDDEFDAASDDMTLWYEHPVECGGWPSRRPAWWTNEIYPVGASPVMHAVVSEESRRVRETTDEEHMDLILRRRQIFAMPTIERERLLSSTQLRNRDRIPTLDAAFHQT
jgi:hypothetical protein